MFETNIVEKIKTHIVLHFFFSLNSWRLWNNEEK